jgi:hypothetical protein
MDLETTSIWNQGWESVGNLDLYGDEAEEWNQFIHRLQQSVIRHIDVEGEIIWSKRNCKGRFNT